MPLLLNEPERYKGFYGRIIDQIPELIAEGRVPMSTAGLMERRLNSKLDTWRNNNFDTGDGVAYNLNGSKLKIILDAQPLREITGDSKLSNGGLVLPDGAYENLEGPEFTRKQLMSITERGLTPGEVRAHPVWQILARNKDLLEAYIDATFAGMKESFGYENGMGVYLGDPWAPPILRKWTVNKLNNGSDITGWSVLDTGVGLLVGVKPDPSKD